MALSSHALEKLNSLSTGPGQLTAKLNRFVTSSSRSRDLQRGARAPQLGQCCGQCWTGHKGTPAYGTYGTPKQFKAMMMVVSTAELNNEVHDSSRSHGCHHCKEHSPQIGMDIEDAVYTDDGSLIRVKFPLLC